MSKADERKNADIQRGVHRIINGSVTSMSKYEIYNSIIILHQTVASTTRLEQTASFPRVRPVILEVSDQSDT